MMEELFNLRREIAALWAAVRQPVDATRGYDNLWFKPASTTLITAGIWEYTGIICREIDGTAVESNVKARNVFEFGNTTTFQADYVISAGGSACSDITGIKPAPLGKHYRVTDGQVISSKFYRLFHWKNDPIVHG